MIIQAEFARIAGSKEFQGAPRQQSFLEFIVDETLAGRGNELKELVIASAVYNKTADYDPRIDSTVRVEASKLRQRLEQYYAGAGACNPVRLSIPKGGYQLRCDSLPCESMPVAPSPAPTVAGNGMSGRPWRAAFFVLAGLATIGVLSVWFTRTRTPPYAKDFDPARVHFNKFSDSADFSSSPAIAPNGEYSLFVSDRESTDGSLHLWRQTFDGRPPLQMTSSPASPDPPTISADGAIAAFRTPADGGHLSWVPATGGEAVSIPESTGARHPRFSPKGRSFLYWNPRDEDTEDYGRVYLARGVDGKGLSASRLFGDFAHAARPLWSEDGSHVLVFGTWQPGAPDKEFDAWLLELDGRMHAKGPPRKTGLFPVLKERGLYRNLTERRLIEAGDWRGGWLYLTIPIGESMDLFRIRMDSHQSKPLSEPERLTAGTAAIRTPRVAAGGRMIFSRIEASDDLYSLAGPNLTRATPGVGGGANLRAAVDSSGSSVVWEKRGRGTGRQVWYLDLKSGARRHLGWEGVTACSYPLISPDARAAAYRIAEPGREPIYLQPVTGGEVGRRICDNCGAPSDWTADGRHVLYITGGHPAIVGLLDLDTGKARDWIQHPSYDLYGARARLSATGDGWVAVYANNGARTRQIYLVPVRGFMPEPQQEWIPATDGAHWDQSPAWSLDGRTLYYVNRHDGFACVMARSLDGAGHPVGQPRIVQHFHSPSRSLMHSAPDRGTDGLWAARGDRLFLMLENVRSELWWMDLNGRSGR